LAFRSQEAVSEQLDQRQLENPQKPPARWKLYGTGVSIGASTYWGAAAFSRFVVQDILANRTHLGLYAQRGSFKYIDYTYLDRSRRWGLAANVSQIQYPLYYFLYNFQGEYPRYPSPDGDQNQFTLNNTWVKETSAALYADYPFSKWSRVELGVRPRKRTYFLPLTDADIEYYGDQISAIDRQFYDFFKDSNGRTNVGLTAAFVHDTVLYSNNTLGPLHGDALRAQVEYAPGLNKGSEAYLTAQVDARKYIRLSDSTVFAVRVAGMNSTRPSGDFMIMGGSDMLRNYPYFSVAGNQVGYGSAELRLPVADVALLSAIPFRVRGVLFGDYALAKWSHDAFQTRREWAYGFGLQTNIFMPMN
ncbi:MAG: BamA/TamA family outer membrane protein, partial [Candidatus Colwellbacteria bacterium]